MLTVTLTMVLPDIELERVEALVQDLQHRGVTVPFAVVNRAGLIKSLLNENDDWRPSYRGPSRPPEAN